ncbi:hypothetical protein HGRIS_007371 [Hohenbuehelia grisea]|uniref:PEBP-like protein n=1 Tax=Hohenbuehelia grisea TaxID=104357 RepID=A0ABR3J4J8_9AGAR
MFAIRKAAFRPVALALRRGNASVVAETASSSATPTPPPSKSAVKPSAAPANSPSDASASTPDTDSVDASAQAKTKGKGRRRQRPVISAEKPRQWNLPLAPGVLPAYDEALKVIQKDSAALKAEAKELQEAINQAEQATSRDEDQLGKMKEKLRILEVQSEINLPDVRWSVANAMVDMSKPVHRHLMEQKWRKDGDLDLLMERIHQMKVVPDVMPDLHPSIDLRVTTVPALEEFRVTRKRYSLVEPGVFLVPYQTRRAPKLYANVFHTDTRLYTLLMVDPDVPDESAESFTAYLHWLQPNIPLCATHQTRIAGLNSHTTYIPPHPQQGTPYHRYVLLLLPQSDPTKPLEIPVVPDSARLGFDTRAFMQEWGFDGARGGGAHMWREIWSEDVSKIYSEVLKTAEPRFGQPPRSDPYATLKRTKRYV